MATISEVHSFYLDLLTYQCNLSQRTYLTGLMMSLIASCDHDVIVASQHTLKSLHDAKVAASKQLSVSSSLRESYKRYSTMKKDFEKWINAVSCLCKDCPIGSQHSITWLLQQCEVLHASGVKLKQLKEDFVNESKSLSSKEMCSQVATKEANRNINELLNKQEACMLQLSSLADTLRAVDSGWTNFNRVYEESCLTLDDKESQFEMVPCLSVTNFVKEFERHVTHLQQILNGSEREADRIQSVAHNLRLSVTVPSVLQTLDKQTKSVKSRESKLYTQKLPLTIERWQKAQQLLVRYEKSCDQIRQLIQGALFYSLPDN
ncbi:hypothetical protein EB796_002039 [Bugula neritina]|uniref:Uncharacterized protein n=1 Tax=Bugula neritina TaxID=10212 RepID=A0A7J7KNB0_BUGNE|nr:hypothetical protein EB796_002039 [Bugula neritina]